MGLATRKPGSGEIRLGLTATAASAVLYSAVVLFGVVPASPSALDGEDHRGSAVVLVPARHDSAGTGPAKRLPQASPGPVRHLTRRSKRPPEIRSASRPSPPTPSASQAATTSPPPAGPAAARPSSTTPAGRAVTDSLLATVTPAVQPQPLALPETPALPAVPPPPAAPALPAMPEMPALPSLP